MAGCGACATRADKSNPAGCGNHGACSSGDCNKLNSFDWLADMDLPVADRFDVVEVKFKGGRKSFYRNADRLHLYTGDAVVVDVPNGHHIGHVSLQGELVRLQMKKKGVANDEQVRKIYRLATQRDIDKYREGKNREAGTLYRSRQIIQQMNLDMKLSDVEFQADGNKATFYYSAEGRVDFRELIKVLAGEFHIRVDMRQISLRHEASRLGGIGSCGRELCCSTWLTEFKNVNTAAARYQNLSLNPSKISGQCGRLKCCLNYELDTYMDALKDIPDVKSLETKQGKARLQKTDIFRKLMWFAYKDDSDWVSISAQRAAEVMHMNKKGETPETLAEDHVAPLPKVEEINSDLERMNKKFDKRNQKKKKRRSKRGKSNPGNQDNQ